MEGLIIWVQEPILGMCSRCGGFLVASVGTEVNVVNSLAWALGLTLAQAVHVSRTKQATLHLAWNCRTRA